MQRGLTGHDVPLPSAAGEKARALVRNPLPPAPALELDADLHELIERSLRVHRLLQAQPILSIASAGEGLQLSVPTATASLKHLPTLGMVRETTGRNYRRNQACDRNLKILSQGMEP